MGMAEAITLHSRQSAGRESEQRRVFRADCATGGKRGDKFLLCPFGDRFDWAKGYLAVCVVAQEREGVCGG